MQNTQNDILGTLKRALEKMSPAERQKALLLYEMYLEYGAEGLEIAEDLMDERSTSHPDFDEPDFRQQVKDSVELLAAHLD